MQAHWGGDKQRNQLELADLRKAKSNSRPSDMPSELTGTYIVLALLLLSALVLMLVLLLVLLVLVLRLSLLVLVLLVLLLLRRLPRHQG